MRQLAFDVFAGADKVLCVVVMQMCIRDSDTSGRRPGRVPALVAIQAISKIFIAVHWVLWSD